MLSIAINIYPGTDLYRFRLQLETLVHETDDVNNYLYLCKDLLNGWEKNKFEIFEDKFESKFIEHNFIQSKFDPELVELILAIDVTKDSKINADKHEEEFINFCHDNSIRHFQIIKNSNIKLGVSGMRNMVMQIFKGDYLMFRDDDDFSQSISKLTNQCIELSKLNFGKNDQKYQKHLPTYNHISEMYDYLNKHQKYPTIAILMSNVRLKNTWGSIDNPFSKTPTPVDTSTVELVDRPSYTSMCSKIFSRESINLINNSTCCQSLEDSRSHYLQQLVQHCVWVFDEKRLEKIRNDWYIFLQSRFIEKRDTIKWLNRNVLNYQFWQINLPKLKLRNLDGRFTKNDLDRFHEQILFNNENDYEKLEFKSKIFNKNIKRLDFFIKNRFISSSCSPDFAYVLPSGSQSGNSWCWCSVIGLLEAYRNANKQFNFSIEDLRKLKTIITSTIHTTLINTNNEVDVEYISDEFVHEGNELAKCLKEIANYKYIYWFGIVNKPSDWDRFSYLLTNIRLILQSFPNDMKINEENIDLVDRIFDEVYHPNSSVKILVNDYKRELSLTNTSILRIDLNNQNYTLKNLGQIPESVKKNKFEKNNQSNNSNYSRDKFTLTGGDSDGNSVPLLNLNTADIPDSGNEAGGNPNTSTILQIIKKLFMFIFIIVIIIVIISIYKYFHRDPSNYK